MPDKDLVTGYKLVICQKIDSFLKDKKMSNKDFGSIFGVTEGAVRRWRSGLVSLDINQIVKLCEFWNITLYELLDIKDPHNLDEVDKERLKVLRDNPELAVVVDNYKK